METYTISHKDEKDILSELDRAWIAAKNAGLIAGEYYSVEDMQYQHDQIHDLLGEGETMSLDKAKDAVRWLNRVIEVAGLIDSDTVYEAIEHAINESAD